MPPFDCNFAGRPTTKRFNALSSNSMRFMYFWFPDWFADVCSMDPTDVSIRSVRALCNANFSMLLSRSASNVVSLVCIAVIAPCMALMLMVFESICLIEVYSFEMDELADSMVFLISSNLLSKLVVVRPSLAVILALWSFLYGLFLRLPICHQSVHELCL